jgi:hypothetical protein
MPLSGTQEECCLKKEENFSLTLSWYSALNLEKLKALIMLDLQTKSAINLDNLQVRY